MTRTSPVPKNATNRPAECAKEAATPADSAAAATREEARNAEVVEGAALRPHTTTMTTKTMDRTGKEVVVGAEAACGVEEAMLAAGAMTHQTSRRNGMTLKNRKRKITL